MSYDFTQEFINECKACLSGSGGGMSEAEVGTAIDTKLDAELDSYSPRTCPIQAMPVYSSIFTMMPTSIFPRTSMTEYIPFMINNASRSDDGENLRTEILGNIRNFFDANTLRTMYTHILEHNELFTAETSQQMQSMDLFDLLNEFVKIEVRSINNEYCTTYTLQRLPRAASDTDLLTLNFKLSWLGSDARVYYTILTITVNSRPATFANTIEATEIVAEGLNPSKLVQIAMADDMDMEAYSIMEYIQNNTTSVFQLVYETFGFTDELAFAKVVKEFDIEFYYRSDPTLDVGVTHTRTVHFTRNNLYVDKQDQWLPWPMMYDFTYRGELDDDRDKKLIDVTYMCDRQDAVNATTEYSCRIGATTEYIWS